MATAKDRWVVCAENVSGPFLPVMAAATLAAIARLAARSSSGCQLPHRVVISATRPQPSPPIGHTCTQGPLCPVGDDIAEDRCAHPYRHCSATPGDCLCPCYECAERRGRFPSCEHGSCEAIMHDACRACFVDAMNEDALTGRTPR